MRTFLSSAIAISASIHLDQLIALELEAQIGAAALHRMAARVLAEHERIPRRAHVLGAHDLVGAAILQHAVLVDAGFVRERIAADDRLVHLHALTGELREHLARRVDLLRARRWS